MERLAEQPQIKIDKEKSFDVLASVDMYRFDLERFGHILPETRQRVFDEELSHIAEGVNRPLRTEFVLKNINGELSYFDRGQWVPYIATLVKGLEVAKQEAGLDPRKDFLTERAAADLKNGYAFLKLGLGEQTAWYSPFPEEEQKLYGEKFVRDLGFWPARKMGFLYLASKNLDGSVTLQSQSVDNSDEEAFEAALSVSRLPDADMDMIRNGYDRQLGQKYGAKFFAGRDLSCQVSQENAWDAINRHKDLLGFYFDEIETLARQNASRQELEIAKKRLTYGVWAALKERLDTHAKSLVTQTYPYVPSSPEVLRHEVNVGYRRASERGDVMPGCGGAVRGEQDLLSASMADVFDSIFGGGKTKDGKETWSWKTGVCRVDGCPTRPSRTKVGPCKVCVNCQHLFDKGKDPTSEYKTRRSKAPYN